MVRPKSPLERLPQCRRLSPEGPARQICERVRSAHIVDESIEHRAAGHAEHVGRHGRELDVRIIQDLVQAVDRPAALLRDGLAIAREVPQLVDRRWWHEAPPQEPVLQQLGDPDAVLHVGLPFGPCAICTGVDEDARERLLQDIEDLTALHRDVVYVPVTRLLGQEWTHERNLRYQKTNGCFGLWLRNLPDGDVDTVVLTGTSADFSESDGSGRTPNSSSASTVSFAFVEVASPMP